MNKQVKDKLVKALRSGDYEQANDQLKDDDNNYCCLGVLCDLHSKETGTPWGVEGSYLGAFTWLPNDVHRWSGLDLMGELKKPIMVSGEMMSTLVGLNDSTEYTFEQIADVIEDQF